MAHQDAEIPVGEAKFPAETNAASHDPERHAAGLTDQQDYPVERVEAVYRCVEHFPSLELMLSDLGNWTFALFQVRIYINVCE